MSIQDNKDRIQRFFQEVVGRGNQETVNELLATSCRYYDAGILKTTGTDEFNAYLTEALKPHDNLYVEIDNMIAEGNQVTVRCSYHVMLEGELSIVPVMAEFHFEEGKIVEMWRTVASTSSGK
jgi:predicted SnoaL-like aldol condensation-catalyzing enzyme